MRVCDGKALRYSALLLLGLIYGLLICLQPLVERGSLAQPPEPGDGPDYDNIAVNVALGRGFGVDWNLPAWREAYTHPSFGSTYRGLLERTGDFVPTAYRPPLYPTVLAAVYLLFGRDFAIARVIHGFALAVALLIVVIVVWRSFGAFPAVAILLLAGRDLSFPLWSHSFYAEAFIVLLVGAVLVSSLYLQGLRRAAAIGALAALLVLSKGMFVIWVPFLFMLALSCPGGTPEAGKRKLRQGIIFSVVLFLILAPWMIRNIFLLKGFYPLGTQAGVNIAYDYSDSVRTSGGVWLGAVNDRELAELYSSVSHVEGLARERALHEAGVAKAKGWIALNYSAVPGLVLGKVYRLWWRDTLIAQKVLVLLALFGLLAVYQRKEIFIPCCIVLIAQSVSVGLTHSVPAGRFLVALYPVLYLLVAAAVWRWLCPYVRSSSAPYRESATN